MRGVPADANIVYIEDSPSDRLLHYLDLYASTAPLELGALSAAATTPTIVVNAR